MPRISKCRSLTGKSVILKNITVADAEFVYTLRSKQNNKGNLSATTSLNDQINWINEYKEMKDQAYFIICDKLENRLGCIRMYHPNSLNYSWGSWVMVEGLSPSVAVESMLLIYSYGIYLGFKNALLSVRQINKNVWKFHENFTNACLVREDSIDRHYIITHENIISTLKKYSHLVPTPLRIIPLEDQ